MKYMGSKNKISSEIKEFIDLNREKNGTFADLCCGGCNISDKITGKRIANDNNKYLIAMWKGLQADLSRPKDITKQMYINAKKDFENSTNLTYSDFLIGWIGFMASFNGKFFNGYAENENRNYIKESINNIEKQIDLLKDVQFFNLDYSKVELPEKSTIYLDIPYKGTTKYKTDLFNYDNLYLFAEEKSRQGHKVFISEYWMPEDRFVKVWSKQVACGVTLGNSNRIESLFIPKGQKIFKQLSLF